LNSSSPISSGIAAGGASSRDAGERHAADSILSVVIHVVFVVSGMAALLYQLIWQRALLVLYGSNTESVAMIVSAFLVGLGFGGLIGGAISRRKSMPLVLAFSIVELLIGLYGLFSLRLFSWVGERTLSAGTLETGILAFALVLIPTVLMGATLPLLVAYRVNAIGHVGRSVSWLYFVNTVGASLGAILAPVIFLRHFGLSGSVRCAAILNLLTAAAMLWAWLWGGRKSR
jgi:predicted membrane-bound spermidine synthase